MRNSYRQYRQYQIEISNDAGRRPNGEFYCGEAVCPFCEKRNEVILWEVKGQPSYGVLEKNHCHHAKMAVDAGSYKIAIHFEGHPDATVIYGK